MNTLNTFMIVMGLVVGSNLYANGEETTFNATLLDGEGMPLCRLADGVRINPDFMGEEMLPESRLSEEDREEWDNLAICDEEHIFNAVMDARGEEISIALAVGTPTSASASIVKLHTIISATLGALGGCFYGFGDEAWHQKIHRGPSYTMGLGALWGVASGLISGWVVAQPPPGVVFHNATPSRILKAGLFGVVAGALTTTVTYYSCFKMRRSFE